MIEVLAKAAEEKEKMQEVTKKNTSFNPDRRLDTSKNKADMKPSDHFDPDKRLEPKAEDDLPREEKLDRLSSLVDQYVEDIVNNSEYPETLGGFKINPSELRKISVEEQEALRKEFGNKKRSLINEWERVNGMEWPRYTEDVYDKHGNQIRKAGNYYDAHHKVPLSLGGENTVDNITPLHADVHYDHRGVHEKGSAFDEMKKVVKEMA